MDRRVARWIGVAVEIAGLVTLVSCLLPAWRDRLSLVNDLVTPGLTKGASGLAALAGATLVLVGRGVAGRRRVAWLVAVVALGAATVAHLAKGLDVEAAAVTAAAAGALLWWRRLFVVGPAGAQVVRVLRVAIAALAVSLLYGVAGLALNHRDVRPSLTPVNALQEVGARLVGLPGPLAVGGRFGYWFPASLTALGLLTVVAVLSAVLAPVALPGGGSEQELAEAGVLVDRPDGDTLDPFLLRRDKRRVFSIDRRAALGYRYVRGVGLASGDPAGDPGAFDTVLRDFLAMCTRMGWRPAIVGARGELRPLYEGEALHAIYIGDEAVLDVPRFTLAGRPMRNARQAVSRTRNAGVTTEFHREGDIRPDLREELLAVAAAQRGSAREFGFSMTLGDLLSGDHPQCLVIVSRDTSGQPVAFQRYIPCRAGLALSLDVMRRLPTAPNGVNERMIVDTIGWARSHRVDVISLNFAAFRSLLERDADLSAAGSVGAWLVRRLEGHFGIQMDSLRRFNAKFQPAWTPRYLVYRSRADLPAIGLAALSAEGFLGLDGGRANSNAVGRRMSRLS